MASKPTAAPAAPSGNGKLLELRREGDSWEVRFLSEPRTSPQALWFHLKVSDVAHAPVRFVWDPQQLHTLRPVLKADDGDWRRCEAVTVAETPDGRKQVVFEQSEPCQCVSAAFCYPYGPDDLAATLDELADTWERTVIGLSGEGREFLRLRLGADRAGAGEAARPGAYFVARQHAGETPGSWVMDGILRFVASDAAEAREG